MHVASLELCKELYELSEWEPCDSRDTVTLRYRSADVYLLVGVEQDTIPAYDLGYLLRRLPDFELGNRLQLVKHTFTHKTEWHIGYGVDPGNLVMYSSTPEDAAAKLCIQLIKQGVIDPKKED